jgi:hypothetical protein
VPQCFVGTAARLEAAVGLLCDEMAAAFKSQGLTVPPWRSKVAMLSKWAPRQLAALAAKIEAVRSGAASAAAAAARPPALPPIATCGRSRSAPPLARPAAAAAAGFDWAESPAAPAGGSPATAPHLGAVAGAAGAAGAAGRRARSLLAAALKDPASPCSPGCAAAAAAAGCSPGTPAGCSPRADSPAQSGAASGALIRTVANQPGWGAIRTVRWGGALEAGQPGAAGAAPTPLEPASAAVQLQAYSDLLQQQQQHRAAAAAPPPSRLGAAPRAC